MGKLEGRNSASVNREQLCNIYISNNKRKSQICISIQISNPPVPFITPKNSCDPPFSTWEKVPQGLMKRSITMYHHDFGWYSLYVEDYLYYFYFPC